MLILDYDRPISREARFTDNLDEPRDSHLADLDEVLDRARDHVLSPREGAPDPLGGAAGQRLASVPLSSAPTALLDLEGTVEAVLTAARNPQSKDFQVHVREHQTRNYVILVDHSGSMTGGKLELAATLAALLAQLSAAGRADYAVIAFEQGLVELKSLGEDCDVENVVERILRLPEGRFTDLGAALAAAAERAEALPDATDVVLISDCMPTRGVLTFEGLAELARQIPSLYVCYTYEPVSATQLCGGRASRIERYQSWARRWVGADRFAEVSDLEEFGLLIELLSRKGTGV